jgi:hypothetical protein
MGIERDSIQDRLDVIAFAFALDQHGAILAPVLRAKD